MSRSRSTTLPASTAIQAVGLRRSFDGQVVLDGVDLAVARGSILGLLGPNGAGKTTVVRILSTLLRADAGTISVAGHDVAREPAAVRAAIGVTGQFAAVDDLLSPRENLQLVADLLHLDREEARGRIAELLTRFDLEDAADRPTSTLSGGMRRKLDLAMTLVGRPEVIFLDEPTTGLDPRSRRELWQAVRDLRDAGTTILLTTQYLEEADHLADRIAVLDHGRIVAEGTPAELKRRIPGGHVELHLPDLGALEETAAALRTDQLDRQALTVQVPNDGSLAALRQLIDQLDRAQLPVESLALHRPDLDDVFLTLTGRAAAPTVEHDG
ncbi:ATP-binding cassette domain-containing protein [Nitriliruptoraceae bacterium ZYF776]|nr:ATP-binding cassette domain-containing protein [Profundirhabdus halotolerans]